MFFKYFNILTAICIYSIYNLEDKKIFWSEKIGWKHIKRLFIVTEIFGTRTQVNLIHQPHLIQSLN